MAAKQKTGYKTVKSPKTGAELPVGAHPWNTGGKKGRSGRKPDEFRAHMRELTSRPEVVAYLNRCLDGKEGPNAFHAAYKYATEQAHGKAEQRTKISGDPEQPLKVVVERE